MANVSHASLTGTNLHEPKGVATALVGQAYIANGIGSGAWTNISTTAFTGMIADFPTPVAPSGWLELDGTVISSVTFPALYALMTIQQTGSRGVGSPTITGLSSTTNMRPGYFVFGTGITSGTTINTVDSATQITMSANAVSSGTSTVIVSPWLLNTNSIKLPDISTSGRYRRSRTSSLHIGVVQTDLLRTHTHSGTTNTTGSPHTHTMDFQSNIEVVGSNPHKHTGGVTAIGTRNDIQTGGGATVVTSVDVGETGEGPHTHRILNTTGIPSGTAEGSHTHTFGTSILDGGLGGAETRPITLVVMTCIKT